LDGVLDKLVALPLLSVIQYSEVTDMDLIGGDRFE